MAWTATLQVQACQYANVIYIFSKIKNRVLYKKINLHSNIKPKLITRKAYITSPAFGISLPYTCKHYLTSDSLTRLYNSYCSAFINSIFWMTISCVTNTTGVQYRRRVMMESYTCGAFEEDNSFAPRWKTSIILELCRFQTTLS